MKIIDWISIDIDIVQFPLVALEKSIQHVKDFGTFHHLLFFTFDICSDLSVLFVFQKHDAYPTTLLLKC